jgi:hypothetical protein
MQITTRIDWRYSQPQDAGYGTADQVGIRKRGLIGGRLITVSFQAPPFYQMLGYGNFGESKDRPGSMSHYRLEKRFQAGTESNPNTPANMEQTSISAPAVRRTAP